MMLIKGASVPIGVAAELAKVEVRDIRQWAAAGALTIELQGGMEVVRLDRVEELTDPSWRASPDSRREALRARLKGATTDTLSVTGLQERARESADTA